MKAISQNKYIALHKYNEPGVRKTAHGIKAGDYAYIYRAAEEMAAAVPENAVLVPVPSHKGYATTSLALAIAIAERTGVQVMDVLRGDEREPLYKMKKRGEILQVNQLGFRIEGSLPENRMIFFVDNVVATGTTIAAAIEAAGRGIGFVFAHTNANLKQYRKMN